MNLPNKLTLARIVAIPPFVGLLLAGEVFPDHRVVAACRWCALALFAGAALTDYIDGRIARSRGIVTAFGQLMDPLADKLLTMSAFVAFVEMRVPPDRPVFPAWAIILILAREYLVTGLRGIALARGRLIQADRWGKHKTVWQLGGILLILTGLAIRETVVAAGGDLPRVDRVLRFGFPPILFAITGLTAVSGIAFVVKNRDVLREGA